MTLSRARLQQLLDRSTDIVVATDRKGTVVYYNDGAQKGLGYTQDEVLDTFVGRLYPDLQEAKRVKAAMRSPEHGGKGIVETFETRFLSKGGEEIPVAISGTLLYDEQGAEDGTIGFAKDLRDILHRDQLATLGEVAVGLSHEINNPLAVILNQSALLEGDVSRLGGERDVSVENERLDAIRREVTRISQIVARLGEMVQEDSYETVQYVGPAKMVDLRRKREGAPDPRLEGLHILVVDDDSGICETLKEILEGDGCRVETASDGKQALARLETDRFELMLTDVVMPEMDGHALFQAARKKHPDMPVLMMTAFHYDKDHIIKRSRLEGLDAVIFKKPVDPQRLRQVIAESVGRS